ncbi:hypothetical protein GCM10011386_26760 [Parapedobacter defluvii]|uniref:FecR family protein n=1 Tax=Parapedobacter defluvii TaxID=2045106 RepID=A0ABQ1M2E4_9SPHI|nr:FecR domain-containing protein [Parapedobacter defluvii]GGC33313.1 hypothetical protein GCM10011386_26760 [Parapedobacter defluvii]
MDQHELEALIKRYKKGECTPEEAARLKAWYNRALERQQGPRPAWDYDALRKDVFAEIMRNRQSQGKVRRLSRTPIRITAAAAVIIALSVGFYFFGIDRQTADIAPGGNRATLTLADGHTIELSEEKTGIVIGDLLTYDDGTALDEADAGQRTSNVSNLLTISTPKGGQYQITLPDGTKVWLNAASSLRYPIAFTGNERNVELTGEGYFEVAHNKAAPFRVHTEGQDVEVLGTHFNINSYADEPAVRTTLLEGSVRVHPAPDYPAAKPALLLPGQQSVLSTAGLQLQEVDTDEAIDWKNGEFVCHNEPLESIMRKLARWYNVDVEYRDTISGSELFSGTISRYDDVSTMLRMLEQAGDIRFEIRDRTILVYNK